MNFYELKWFGKEEMLKNFNDKFKGEIIYDKEKSINFDKTKNIYIEGDNLDALKAMLPKYKNKIDIIYIDPPYNTGKNFFYNDNFHIKNNKLSENDKFHSKWLNMIYPRLKLANLLLSERGVIFVSIDEYEIHNLKIICNEIFGEKNFVGAIVWEKNKVSLNKCKNFSKNHEYILVYCNNINKIICNGIKRSDERLKKYKNRDNDYRGAWVSGDFTIRSFSKKNYYKIISPSGKEHYPPDCFSWRFPSEKYKELLADNRIWFGENGDAVPTIKRFLNEIRKNVPPLTLWRSEEVGTYNKASKDLKNILENKFVFEYPKPVELIKKCISLYSQKDSIILDFFSGTATTAHSVMELNSEDKGHRRFIMVQEPFEFNKNKTNLDDNYKTICDIAQERIKKVGNKILNNFSNENSLDIGFKVVKIIKD